MKTRIRRKAINVQTAETFIETSPADWAETLENWKQKKSPCPMPIGHIMFVKPNHPYRLIG